MWDRMDEQDDMEREDSAEEEVRALERECVRLGIPLPPERDEVSPDIRHRRREMQLYSRRDELKALLAKHRR